MARTASTTELRFETANYLLRPLTPADISDEWGDWLANPENAERLNAPCRRLSRSDLDSYLKRFDNKANLLLGIFHKPSATHIGIFTVIASRDGQNALFNVLIGAAAFRTIAGIMEMREIRTAVGNYVFFDRGYQSAVASVVATNKHMIAYLKLAGWELVKRSVKGAVTGQGSVDLLTFRLTRHRYVERNGASWMPPVTGVQPTAQE